MTATLGKSQCLVVHIAKAKAKSAGPLPTPISAACEEISRSRNLPALCVDLIGETWAEGRQAAFSWRNAKADVLLATSIVDIGSKRLVT